MLKLLESVSQLEDLNIDDFLHKVENLSVLELKKSFKGFDFFFGIDEDGKLFSSKYGDKDKFYNSHRYHNDPDNNAYIGAHKYIFKFKHDLEKILKPHEVIESKIVFFNQKFEKTNKIVLKEPNQSIEDILQRTLIRSNQTFSIDGRNTNTIEMPSFWECSESEDIKHIDIKGIKAEVDKLKDYLIQPCGIDKHYSNYDISTLNLTSIKSDKRTIYKVEREKINDYILSNFKLPIKQDIIDNNNELEIIDGEDTVEIKKDTLLKNNFFLSPKHELAGVIRTSDPNAKLELKGGLYGVVQIRIATMFGVPELANIQSAKKVFSELKGETPEDTARNFANSLDEHAFFDIKTKLIAIYKNLANDVADKLDVFNNNSGEYKLKLSDSSTLEFDEKDIEINLNAFGELSSIISKTLHKLKISKNLTDIILVIYQRTLDIVHNEIVKESISLNNTKALSAESICYAYTANYIVALLLLRDKDKRAANLLRDNRGSIKTYNIKSPLNAWGYLLFSSNYNKTSERYLSAHTLKDLKKITGRIIDKRVKFVHDSISKGNNLIQDWKAHEEHIKLFMMRLESYEYELKDVVEVITYWDDANLSDKTIVINKLYFYMQRHDPNSKLFPLLKDLANSILINTKSIQNSGVLMKESLLQLLEDDAAAADTTPAAGSTTAGAIAALPKKMFKNKVIQRKVRNFSKAKKFTNPKNTFGYSAVGQIDNDVSDASNNFESFLHIDTIKSIILEWNDEDYCQNYKGFDYVREKYNLAISVIKEKNESGFPDVKLSGETENITRFLLKEYGLGVKEIKKMLNTENHCEF
jgi:hypothetical protein